MATDYRTSDGKIFTDNGSGFEKVRAEDHQRFLDSQSSSSSGRSSGPDAEARQNNEADGYKMAKNYDKAISLYNQIIDQGSRFKYTAYYMRAECYMVKGNYDQAKSDFKRSADLGYKPALEALAKLGIQYTPNSGGTSSSTLLQEADQFFNEGNYAKAIVKYSQTISKGENKSLALMKRAACYAKKGDKEQAIDDYTAAINSGVLTGNDLATAKAELAKLK
jgi:tetratricopeptide (TPR) repeat protein